MNRKRQVAMNSLPPQQGFTLIEIMISLLLGVFLLGGVIGVFLNTKQTYRVQDGLSRLQENGRYAMEFMGRDIRMADYKACPTDDFATSGNVPISGVNNNTAADSIDNGTDEINVRWFPTCGALPQGAAYDIRSANLAKNSSSLIEGVQDMQIKYGADTDGDGAPNYYADAGTAGLNMSQVVTVRVSLLLRTIDDNIASKPLQYIYNGATVIPNDRRIRRVFSSTFALRNRIH
jgi:type IV pilus assembly protein PilW